MRIETTPKRATTPRAKALSAALSIIIVGVAGLTGNYYLNPVVDIGLEVLTQYEYDQLVTEYKAKRIEKALGKPTLCARMKIQDTSPLSYQELSEWAETLDIYVRDTVLTNKRPIAFTQVSDTNLMNQLNSWLEAQP